MTKPQAATHFVFQIGHLDADGSEHSTRISAVGPTPGAILSVLSTINSTEVFAVLTAQIAAQLDINREHLTPREVPEAVSLALHKVHEPEREYHLSLADEDGVAVQLVAESRTAMTALRALRIMANPDHLMEVAGAIPRH